MYVTRRPREQSLSADFNDFITTDFGAKSLDLEGDNERRPDYIRGSLLIEMKSLEVSPQDKVEALLEPDRSKSEWPMAFGMLNEKHFEKSDIFKSKERELRKKNQKSVRDHVKKANKQIRDYGSKNLTDYRGILILLNEDIFELTPEMVCHAVRSEIESGKTPGRTPYDAFDSVIYVSEAHYSPIPHPPYAAYFLTQILVNESETDFVIGSELLAGWAKRSSSPELSVYRGDGGQGNGLVEIVPDRMPRSDLWRHEYKKAPHLASYSRKKLATLFCELIMLSMLTLHKNSPGFQRRELLDDMRRFTEVMEEMSRRGLDLREMTPRRPIQERALSQIKISNSERAWLIDNFIFHAEGQTHQMLR